MRPKNMENGKTFRKCDNCKKPYYADNRNLKRGWGLCCSKRCAAEKRERSKPGYNPVTVAINNERRANWNNRINADFEDNFFSNEDSFQFGRD